MIFLDNKKILITGASSGLGRECAIVCSKIGATVILVARDLHRLKQTFELLEGEDHLMYQLDVTDYSGIENLIEDSVSKIGKIDGYIHCAGVEMTSPLQSMNSEKFNQLFSVNTVAAFEFSKILSKKKYYNSLGASFVFISSVTGLLGVNGKIGYCSSKGALIAGAKAMALELAVKKIRVNCILPGMVDTEMFQKIKEELTVESIADIEKRHPLGLGKPSDVANLCAFLLSDLSNWITGSDYIIDGGYSCQ